MKILCSFSGGGGGEGRKQCSRKRSLFLCGALLGQPVTFNSKAGLVSPVL